MAARDFLLEIGTEEIPARFMTGALEALKLAFREWTGSLGIRFESLRTLGTPRRLALYAAGLEEEQPDKELEVRGPSRQAAVDENGQWTRAAEGFARSQGVDVDSLYFKETSSGEYVYARKRIQGRKTEEILQEGLASFVTGLKFPKTMRWGDHDVRFVRPIRWLVALYGNDIIAVEVAGVKSGNATRGHRFLCEGPLVLSSPGAYEELLEKAWVIADPDRRRQRIVQQVEDLARSLGGRVEFDEELLEEVTHLVEYPTALYGTFDAEFLAVPQEVIITSMKEHQRYFPVFDARGKLMPCFITVRNGDETALETVRRGNEKVLRARLSDARFFFEEDRKTPITSFLEKLETVIYQESLGTMADKSRRVRAIAKQLAVVVGLSQREQDVLLRAGYLAKFDLATHMVYEFPELEGVMGREYARAAGEPADVAEAIFEHRLPRFAGDLLPRSLPGAILAVADKIDSVTASFAIGKQPTGSQDPYGLRRQGNGVVQILAERQWALSVEQCIDTAIAQLIKRGLRTVASENALRAALLEFFRGRCKSLLQEKGFRHDVIEAVLHAKPLLPGEVIARAETIQGLLDDDGFLKLVEAAKRVANLVKHTESREVDPERLGTPEEQRLWQALREAEENYAVLQGTGKTQEAFRMLAALVPPIHRFFDNVMVMVEDPGIRANRLALLRRLQELLSREGDLTQIVQ